MTLKVNSIYKTFNILLPIAIICSQWISIGKINLSWIIYIILALVVVLRSKSLFKNNTIIIFSIIVALLPFFTFFIGISNKFNSSLYFSIVTGLICLLYINTLDKDLFKYFLYGCGLACIFFTAMGFYEIFYGKYLFYDSQNFFAHYLNPFGKHYPVAAFSNTNDLSQFIVLVSPCCFYLLKGKKITSVMYIIFSFFIIFNTESKLSLVTFVLTILLAYLIFFNSIKNKKKINNIIFSICFIGLILLIDLYTNFISITIEHFFNLKIDSDYFIGRSNIYLNLLRAAKSLPLGGFGSAYVINTMPPHNLFLYILCDYGWFAIFAFILLLIDLVKKIISRLGGSSKLELLFLSMILSNLLFFPILSSISSCNEQRKATWIFIGICLKVAFDNIKTKKEVS